jgi:uroporphyrinogen-III synthase
MAAPVGSEFEQGQALQGVDLGTVVVACIGPVTAQTAGELGLTVAVEPEEYTIPALVEALGAYFAEA